MEKLTLSVHWRDMPLASRFRLLMACTVMPCAILLALFVNERWNSIQFSRQELLGTKFVSALIDLRVQPWVGGEAPKQGLAQAIKVQGRYGAELRTGKAWYAFEQSLDQPSSGAAGMGLAARAAWSQLFGVVADGSNLILDPDLDTYYLMDAVCLSLAQQREKMDVLADLLLGAKRRGVAMPGEVFEAQATLAELRQGTGTLIRNFQVIVAQSGGLDEKSGLQGPLDDYVAALQQMATNQAWLDPTLRKRSLSELSTAVAAQEMLWRASLASLERLIAARVWQLQRGLVLWVLVTGGILVVAFLLARSVIKGVLGPLAAVGHEVEMLEAGDLRSRPILRGEDEMARFARGLDLLRQRLAEVPNTLAGATGRLATSVEALKLDHIAQGAILESQASALAQTQVTSEEIRQTSKQAADQAKVLIVEAGKARDLSRSGGETLGKSLDSLLTIRSRVELLAADVEALEGRARRIEDIIDSVKDLADQSNLLALNAAIEAMRAGAQGQGFGLVAREIRALADQSIAATEQVRQVLGDLNDGVREAAKASREGVHDIQKGLERVQGSAETLADIQESVGESVGQLQRIAAVVQQQDNGMSQVFLALKDQGDRMLEAARQQEKTTLAVTQLEQAAKTVETVVKSFKI